jgi:hypothetical protein
MKVVSRFLPPLAFPAARAAGGGCDLLFVGRDLSGHSDG